MLVIVKLHKSTQISHFNLYVVKVDLNRMDFGGNPHQFCILFFYILAWSSLQNQL